MKKLPIILAVTFFLSTLFLIYFFIFRGNVIETEDSRVVIELSEPNAEFALKEMREFLESVQQINEGILDEDADQIYEAALKSGGSVIEHSPEGMMASLPIGFKKLGFSVHDKFDEIADSIKSNNDFDYTHRELNNLLNSCIACHRTYKVSVKE